MDQKLQKYYEDQFSMFASPGWKEVINKIDELFDHYNDIEHCTDEKMFQFRKGQLDILRWLSTWEETVKETYEGLENG
jgi:hypothetical protein